MQFDNRSSDAEFWNRVEHADRELRSSFRSTVTFGIDGWPGPATVGQWGFEGGVRSVIYANFRHDAILTIYTDDALEPRAVVEQLRQDAVTDVPDDLTLLDVGDVPVVFETWGDRVGRWGGGIVSEHSIVFHTPHSLDSIPTLVPIVDIEPYIEGRHGWIRRAREGLRTGTDDED